MAQHKWAKEIKAWADGAEIEWRFFIDNFDTEWTNWQSVDKPPLKWNKDLKGEYKFNGDFSTFDDKFELRIKPQPKEPQYLYVYFNSETKALELDNQIIDLDYCQYVGKIKLESDDE
jgi:hypothetical protein